MSGFRIERINSELIKCISDIIRNDIKDPRVTEMVSVIAVSTSKDLKNAKVFVSIYGDKEKEQPTFEALKGCSSFIRRQLSNKLKELRQVPMITFVLDKSMEYGEKIDAILGEIKNDGN